MSEMQLVLIFVMGNLVLTIFNLFLSIGKKE